MDIEVRPIEGFNGYFVDSDGNIIRKNKDGFLKPQDGGNGYKKVSLVKNGKVYNRLIHRIVAQAFIPNPENLPQVNHKDENKANNCVENLEWCTSAYNNNYGTRGARMGKTELNRSDCSKAVIQYTLGGDFIAEYPSVKEARRQTNMWKAHIGECCSHYKNQYTAGGYRWAWKSEVEKHGNPYR